MIDVAFGHWLAGLTDGEGAFVIAKPTTRAGEKNWRVWQTCRYEINLRVDDLPVLQTIQRELGFGNINVMWYRDAAPPAHCPMARYAVSRIDDCRAIVDIFTTYPLRAKKAAQFAVWKEGVAEMSKGRARSDDVVEECRTRLAALRVYVPIAPNEDYRALNPVIRRRRREYGTAPRCLCGCGEATNLVRHIDATLRHPLNPNFCSYRRGHYFRVNERK